MGETVRRRPPRIATWIVPGIAMEDIYATAISQKGIGTTNLVAGQPMSSVVCMSSVVFIGD